MQPRLRIPVGHHLLVELAAEPLEHAAVLGIEVAADAQRVEVVQAGIAAGPGALHQEQALAVAHEQVRDDLLPLGIVLGLAAWAVLALGGDEVQIALDTLAAGCPSTVARR